MAWPIRSSPPGQALTAIPIREAATAFENQTDLTIPIGTWKLRLVPRPANQPGQVRVPIVLVCHTDDQSFRELRIELARFELEADPNHLIAADMFTEPHTHLKRSPGNRPVRLIGPGVTLILSGAGLSDMDIKVTGAAGGSDDDFPSARFEPPHFIIGGTGDNLGVACDEVLLDLNRQDNPAIVDDKLPGVDNSWRGMILQELGIFFGDGTQVGTWSGMAAMKDFFIGFDAVDLSGTFIAELVHYALENDPQVQVAIFFQDENGQEVLQTDSGDAAIPAPPAGRDYMRVRLEARPNWDSAGFRISWQIPAGVTVEEPIRRGSLNLGWVRIPAGGQQRPFTVQIIDHRIPDRSETRQVHVTEPPVAAGPQPLTIVFDGILENAGFAPGERPTNRLHMNLTPGQTATITARMGGGSGNVSATLTVPPGFSITAGSATQNVARPAGSNVYPDVQWTISVPAGPPAAPQHLALLLAVVDNGITTNRRLRLTFQEAVPAANRDFELVSYTDWRADPGIGLARLQLLNGLDFGDIIWALESEPVALDLFSDPVQDALFNGAAFTTTEVPPTSLSAGTIRPYLGTDDRLWRLTGQVGADPAAAPARAPFIVGEPHDSDLVNNPPAVIANFLGALPDPAPYQSPDGTTVRTVQFHYDCDQIQPPANPGDCATLGPEDNAVRISFPVEVNRQQALGFAALFRAIDAQRDNIEAIGLFGGASIEGTIDYNLDLAQRRAGAVREALVAPPAKLLTAMTNLPGSDSYNITATAASTIASLSAAGKIEAHSFGEDGAASQILPRDRRVFAILKLKPAAATADIIHTEYFVTLPGAPPPVEAPPTPQKKLQDHPFRHSVFRLAHVEVELLRNELVRLQIRLKLDLEAFNENDLPTVGEMRARSLNDLDGVTTFFLEMKRNPEPGPDEPEFMWEFVVLSDPGDLDGLTLLQKPADATTLDILGGPSIVTPALTALQGGRVGISALAVGVSVGAILSATGLIDVQVLVWRGIRFKLRQGSVASQGISLAVDYTVRYHIDADLSQIGNTPGLPTLATDPANPVELTFRNVGVEFQPDGPKVEFFYNPADGFQLDINDPGVFRLGDGIGRLLSVDRVRAGAGSPLWLEVELSLALETGIFSIDTLRIRISLETDQLFAAVGGEVNLGSGSISISDFDVSINKLGVSVDIPGTLEGRGELAISGGDIEGELDLSLVPLDLRIYAALKLLTREDLRALYAYLSVEFAPGILLGSTGAAIYGFHGLIGVQMERSNQDDALAWFKAPPVGVADTTKWVAARGSWAFGVGTVIGTAFDTGLTFNTKGTFMLELPGPKFLLATDSSFIKPKPDTKSATTGDLVSVVMLDFENHTFLIGIDFTISFANLISFRVPTEIFLNLSSANDWHIRFGQWNPESKRITLHIFDLFKAWGYFVVEGDGLVVDDKLDLQGITLATGSRIEIFWGSRSVGIYLEAYLEYHIGLQLKPLLLQGTLDVGGELHLIIVSLSAHGKLRVIAPEPFVLRGEICGKLDLWLFSIEGCASFTIGDADAAVPLPPNPFVDMVLIDRMTSAAVPTPGNGGQTLAPLDAVLHLIFDYDMIDDRPDKSTNLADPTRPRNQVSEDLYYDYQLTSVTITPDAGGAALSPVQSAWAPYTLPNATAEEANSARTLRLLDWKPTAHERAVDFASGYGETVQLLFERLCQPVPRPTPDCATFDEELLGIRDSWLLDQEELAPVYVFPSQGNGLGAEMLGHTMSASAARVVPLVPIPYPDRQPQRRCLRLPGAIQGQVLSIQDFIDDLSDIFLTDPSPQFFELWQSGLLFIRLPELVTAQVILALPLELSADGQAVFLNEDLKQVSPIISFQMASIIPGSFGSDAFSAHAAKRIVFEQPLDVDQPTCISWLLIRSPGREKIDNRDPNAYLMEICGITCAEWRRWRDAVTGKASAIATLTDLTGVIGGIPAVSANELLERDIVYRVSGTISWSRFRDKNGQVDLDGTHTFERTFRTVNDAPRDIRRYILDTNPLNDMQPHYYAENIQIRFTSDVIDRLFAKFEEQLVVRAKAHKGRHVLNQPLSDGTTREFFPLDSFEETLLATLNNLRGSCLPGAWDMLFPKPVYTQDEPLTPNTGYTVAVIPRPLDELDEVGLTVDEWDRRLQAAFDDGAAVFRFDLRTSRWPSFTAHVAAYRDPPIGDLFAAEGSALNAALGSITVGRGDEAVDSLSVALFGGPMAVPRAPLLARIWTEVGSAPDPFSTPPYRCRGILLDGPEPLLKLLADGSPRVTLEARQTPAANTPFANGTPPAGERLITGARGARLFLLFETADPPFIQIELHDHVLGLVERLIIPVGGTPGSFAEGGS